MRVTDLTRENLRKALTVFMGTGPNARTDRTMQHRSSIREPVPSIHLSSPFFR